MKNLEAVVQERNRAYWLLETGETGERPGTKVKDELGEALSAVDFQIFLAFVGVLFAFHVRLHECE